MAVYHSKNKTEMLRHALQKVQRNTPVTSIGPGSVARSLTEVIINELGDFYNILDFNTAMGVISTAEGRALDLMGELYNVQRKQLGEVATIDQSVGAFYFYINQPHSSDIVIPRGTLVFTDATTYIGEQYTYRTTEDATIRAGRTRVFTSIIPDFSDSVFTAGKNTITQDNYESEPGVPTVYCTNPKTIAPQVGYEIDQNYRNRIVKEVRRSAGGTIEAIRYAGLSVEGVRDVKVRNTPYGLGSVEALVVPEDQELIAAVLTESIDKIRKVAPAGVKLYIKEPEYLTMDIVVNLVVKSMVNIDKDAIARRAEIGILRYLNTLLPGATFVYNRMMQNILESSDTIEDVVVQTMRAGSVEILRRNYKPTEDEQIVPGLIEVEIASANL